jgi:hypothetical protein
MNFFRLDIVMIFAFNTPRIILAQGFEKSLKGALLTTIQYGNA